MNNSSLNKKLSLKKENLKIAIIGGGPMGLAISYQFSRKGFRTSLIEADDRLGGMAASFDFNGLEIERYYHFHCLSDYAFFDLLKEIDLQDKMNWKYTKMGFFYNGKLYKWGSPLSVLTFDKLSLVVKLRYLFHALRCLTIKDWSNLDDINAIDWLKTWIGRRGFRILWSKLFEFKFYSYKEEISAAWIWSRIRRLGLSRSNFKERLGNIKGGSSVWISKLEKEILKFGSEIRLSSPVQKITSNKKNILLTFNNDISEDFDIVISTIPLPLAGKIMDPKSFPDDVLKKFTNQKSVACVCVIIKSNIKITNNFWTNVNDERFSIPGIIEFSNLSDSKPYIVYIPFYMPREINEYSEPDEIFIKKSISCLKAINKKFDEKNIIDATCNRYAFAQPICDINFLEKLPGVNPIKNFWAFDTTIYYPEDRGVSESIKYGREITNQIIDQLSR